MEIARFLGVSRFVQFLSSLNSLTCFFSSPIVTLSSDMLDISSPRDSIQECIKQDNAFGAGVGLEPRRTSRGCGAHSASMSEFLDLRPILAGRGHKKKASHQQKSNPR